MQRVIRFTLLGLAAAASLTACGDKVQVQNPATQLPDTMVTLITVTPSSLPLAVNQTGTLVAAISQGAQSPARTVTWSSSNTAVATIAPSGNTVVVTGRANGTATISATVAGSPSVQGAAVVTVGAGGSIPTPVVFNIANVAQNLEPGSAIANLSNIFRQIDVTFNVDGTGTNAPARIDLIARCTNRQFAADSARIVATQIIATTGASSADAASEAAVPITLSFNTAQLDSTNLQPRFLNGNCQIQGRLTTVGGQVVNSTNVVPLVLNNISYFAATYTYTKTTIQGAANAVSTFDGLRYDQGDLKVALRGVNYNSTIPIVAVSGTLSGTVATDPSTAVQAVLARSFNCSATANAVCTAGTNQSFTLIFPATQGGCPATGVATAPFCINQWTSTSPLLGQQDGSIVTIAASSDQAGNEGFTGPTQGVNNFPGPTNAVLVAPAVANAISPPQTVARTRFDNTSPVLFSHTGAADDYRASFNPSAIRDTLASTNFAAFPRSPGSGTGWISGNVVAATAVPGGTITNTLPFTFSSGSSTSATAVYRSGLNTVGNAILTGSDDRFQATTVQFGYALDSVTAGGTIPGLAGTTASPGIRGTSVIASATALTNCATAGWTIVTTATGIPQTALTSPRDSTYRLRVFEWDALGNIRCTDLANRFGVDNQNPNPLVPNNNLAAIDTTANTPFGSVISFAFVDSLSGFVNNRELWGRSYRNFTPNAANCSIPLGVTCNNIVITPPAVPSEISATTGNTGSASFDIRNGVAVESYQTVEVRSVDQAGNLSPLARRTFLYDATPPTVGGVGFPAAITGGLPSPVFTSSAADNVDLYAVGIDFTYPATGGNNGTSVGDTAVYYGPNFDSTRVTAPAPFSYAAKGPGGFIKQLYQQAVGDAAPTPADPNITGAGTTAQTVTVRAVDAARNVSAPNSAAIPAGNITPSPLVPACSATVTTSCYTTFRMSEPAAPTTLSNGSAAVTLGASIQGLVSSVTSPFSVVCFYYQQTAPGATVFPGIPLGDWIQVPGGCVQLGDVTDAGLIRTWTYRVSWNPDNSLGNANTLLPVRAFGFSATNPGVVHATQPNQNITLVP